MSLERLTCQNGHVFTAMIVNPYDKVHCPNCNIVVDNGLLPKVFDPVADKPASTDIFLPNNTP